MDYIIKIDKRKNRPLKIVFSESDKEWILKNHLYFSTKELGKKFGLSESHMCKRMRKLGIKRTKGCYKGNADIEYWLNVKSIELSYILGLLFADGHIAKNGKKLSLEIIKSDFEEIKNTLLITGNWNIKYRQRKHWKEQAIACFHDKRLCSLLTDRKLKEKNNFGNILSFIPENLHSYFWRGVFDGDGSISLTVKNKDNGVVSIAGPYNFDYSNLENVLKKLNIYYRIVNNISKKLHKSSTLVIPGRNSVIRFCNYLYENRESDKIGFSRKYNRFLNLKELNK